MPIVPQTLHHYKEGDTHIAAQVDGSNLVLGETRNDEHAAEGRYNFLTVIPLAEAIAIAKAVLARQLEDERLEDLANRYDDNRALVDSALEHEVWF